MYELTKRYEEVLYLEFDVVPITNENIFTYIDINKGIACRVNHEKDGKYVHDFLSFNHDLLKDLEQNYENYYILSERSPRAKYWNCRAMLTHDGLDGDNDVYNTGIVLANRENLEKIDVLKITKTHNIPELTNIPKANQSTIQRGTAHNQNNAVLNNEKLFKEIFVFSAW